ncbi:PIN domain-containing protein [candidate division KSB3 bacterium]|uniref:PIN domain-containing protein n=1 Tax=candidate division KSB3 bacterium TaxID=2044937 RepID=A0A9D5JSN4_9BACT|nr:PIN domain-containing protein [candidate division KSB3 bacterium]MBD3323523.1 PIN domain-containing protein [candidate division KSB3 bacterium]
MGGTPSMKLDNALKGITVLGFDTSPFIYFVEEQPNYLDVMREIIRRIDKGILFGYSSVITLTEVLVQPKKLGKTTLEQEYRALLQQSRNFDLVRIHETIAEEAAALRARYAIRTPDALQIAAAIEAGCQAFLTNDKRLQSISELTILLLDDIEL